jgi:hypothetical protein
MCNGRYLSWIGNGDGLHPPNACGMTEEITYRRSKKTCAQPSGALCPPATRQQSNNEEDEE